MSESHQTHVTLHDIDPQALEQLVQYAYTAEIVVGEGNVQVRHLWCLLKCIMHILHSQVPCVRLSCLLYEVLPGWDVQTVCANLQFASLQIKVFWYLCYFKRANAYTTSQKVLSSKIFNVFFKEVSSAHQAFMHLFVPKYSKKKSINLIYFFLLFKITVFYLNVF